MTPPAHPRRRALGSGPGATPPPAAVPAQPVPPAEADADVGAERGPGHEPEAAPGRESEHGGEREPERAPATGAPADPGPEPAAEPAPAEPVGLADPAEPAEPAEPADERSARPAPVGAGEESGDEESGDGEAGGEEPGDDGGAEGDAGDERRFRVTLDNFEGPFDLLLQLISKHKLDVTEVALSRVTDDFMAHIRAMGPDWDLDQTTEFLVVAATLLDLKAARLLPAAEVEDETDLALLEARDLLFARLLQYRAYKRVADVFAERLAAEALRYPRTVGLEPHHAELLPDVVIRIGPEGFARLAVRAMQPKPEPRVYVDHIHAPLVSVREQAEVVVARLRELGTASFAELTADAPDTLTVVARFLALLELYRERAVALDQPEALGPLTVSWSGGAEHAERQLVSDEFDRAPEPEPGDRAPGGEPAHPEQPRKESEAP